MALNDPKTEARIENKERRERVQGLGITVLSIVGFIIIIGIALWGAINALRLAPDFFRSFSLFGTTTPTISISVSPQNAISNESVNISWRASKPKDVDMYVFSFQCKDGVKLIGVRPDGAPAELPCQAAVRMATSTSLLVQPISTATAPVSMGVAITSVDKNGARIAEATTSLTVLPSGNPEAATSTPPVTQKPPTKPTPAPTPAPKPKPRSTPVPATPADLAVRIIAVGVIDPQSGAFVNRPPVSSSDIAAVQFDVANIGGTRTGSWYFTAQLPTKDGYAYQSPLQPSMGAGSHTVYTLKFNRAVNGGVFTVTVDPQNRVQEANESNNSAQTRVDGVANQGAAAGSYPSGGTYPTSPAGSYPSYY